MNQYIITHPNVDLDACACIAMIHQPEIHFAPAGATEISEICPCCGRKLDIDNIRILDHPMGEKGYLNQNGIRHSAFASMPESVHSDPRLIEEVDEQDSTGMIKNPRFSLADILAAVKAELYDKGFRNLKIIDYNALFVMRQIIRGINLLYQSETSARKYIVEQVRFEMIGKYKYAILPSGESSPKVGIILNNEHNIVGTIFQNEFNLGITRFPGHTEPDLKILTSHLPGWFIHSAGFLASWGSKKSPATDNPPEETPQNQEELLELCRKVFSYEN